jgi:hypothetical protein
LLLSSSKPSLGVFQLAGYLLHIPTSTWSQKFLSPLPCNKEEAFTPSSPRHHPAALTCSVSHLFLNPGVLVKVGGEQTGAVAELDLHP